jgi:hypothetical protein
LLPALMKPANILKFDFRNKLFKLEHFMIFFSYLFCIN